MEYRPIRADEIPRFRQFQEYCFGVDPGHLDHYLEHQFRLEYSRAVYDRAGEMRACLVNFPFEIYMEGARLKLGGIAGVASLPEHRREGHVGELLVRCIAEMKEQGYPLSGLYPFKQSFYRRYGWEVATGWLDNLAPVEAFSRFRKSPGVIRRYLPGEVDWLALRNLYRPQAEGRRGWMVRESPQHWLNWVLTPWGQYQWHTALWHPTPQAAPEGAVIYRLDRPKDVSTIVVRQVIALNPAAERGLWGFVANHDSQVKQVRTRTRLDYPLTHLIEDTGSVEATYHHGWQLRLIDLKAAFEARPWPQEVSGSLVVWVRDQSAPWNTGTWKISFEEGRASVNHAPAGTPSLSADVQTWAQLYAGYVTPAAAVRSGRLEAADPAALRLLTLAVAGDPLFFYEFF